MGCNPSTRRGDQVAFYLSSSMLAAASLLAPEIMGPVAAATACSYLAEGASVASFIGGTKLSEPCDNGERAITHVANTIISESILQSILRVTSTTSLVQDATLRCAPTLRAGQTCFEDNDACYACYKNIGAHFAAEETAYRNTWNNQTSEKVIIPDNDTFYALLIARSQECARACKACTFTHVSQAIQINTSEILSNESRFRTDLTTELNNSITSQMNKNSDRLTNLLGTQTDEELASNIQLVSQTISKNLNLNDITNNLNATQHIKIDTSSASVSSVNQQGAFNAIYEVVLNSDILTEQSTQSLLQDIINALDSDTELDAMGRVLVDTVEGVLDTIYYWVLVSVVSFGIIFAIWYARLWIKKLKTSQA